MKDHGVIYETQENEEWKRTLEEIEDETIEEKMDLEKFSALDRVYTKLKLKQLKIELNNLKNCPKNR